MPRSSVAPTVASVMAATAAVEMVVELVRVSLVTVSRDVSVWMWVTVTVAPGSAAPVLSVTLPTMEP